MSEIQHRDAPPITNGSSPQTAEKVAIKMMKCADVLIDTNGKIHFYCKVCWSQFVLFNQFRNHLQCHFKDLPFKCHLCESTHYDFDVHIDHVNLHSLELDVSSKPYYEDIIENTYQQDDIMPMDENVYDTVYLPEKVIDVDNDNTFEIGEDHEADELDDNTEVDQDNDKMGVGETLEAIPQNELMVQQSPDEKKYQCPLCPDKFETSQERLKHLYTHDSSKIFKCNPCRVGFFFEDAMVLHLKKHAEMKVKKPKVHKCSYCGKEFKLKGNLTTHIRSHTGERPYRCEVCGKGFAQSSYIRLHMYSHNGEKPYQCNICGVAYSVCSRLTYHMRKHEGIRGFKCTYCEKEFYTNAQLMDHVRTHTDERPYRCECGKSFRKRDTLRQHARLHTGVKSYKCNICGTGFAQLAGLHGHKKTHKILE